VVCSAMRCWRQEGSGGEVDEVTLDEFEHGTVISLM